LTDLNAEGDWIAATVLNIGMNLFVFLVVLWRDADFDLRCDSSVD
jgi:hypothetical protein